MKAKEKRFLHFLEGSDKHFVIPVYQRNYDWKKELITIAKANFQLPLAVTLYAIKEIRV